MSYGYPLEGLINQAQWDALPMTIHSHWQHMVDSEEEDGPYQQTYTGVVTIETATRVIVFKRNFTGTTAKMSDEGLEAETTQWCAETQKTLLHLLGEAECGVVEKKE
jgi:hypothetical protein